MTKITKPELKKIIKREYDRNIVFLTEELRLAKMIQKAALRQILKGNIQNTIDILSTLENLKEG